MVWNYFVTFCIEYDTTAYFVIIYNWWTKNNPWFLFYSCSVETRIGPEKFTDDGNSFGMAMSNEGNFAFTFLHKLEMRTQFANPVWKPAGNSS